MIDHSMTVWTARLVSRPRWTDGGGEERLRDARTEQTKVQFFGLPQTMILRILLYPC